MKPGYDLPLVGAALAGLVIVSLLGMEPVETGLAGFVAVLGCIVARQWLIDRDYENDMDEEIGESNE